MRKAVREARVHSSWSQPNQTYEAAVAAFIHGILGDPAFCRELETFVGRVRQPGWINSLAQTLVKPTRPGVPGIYQGNELWDLRLVGPTTRPPPDFYPPR